jgi:hypothetical protein
MKKTHLVRLFPIITRSCLQLNNKNFSLIDMRKPLPRDEKRESVIENGENNIVKPEDL